MIIEEIMQKNIHTLSPDDTIAAALQLCRDFKVRHIPLVTKSGELAGLVTDRDIKEATPSILEQKNGMDELQKPLHLIMKTNVHTSHPLDFVEDAAAVFYEQRIGCMPVVQSGEVVGMVTETDMLHTFVKLTGVHQPGSRIEIRVENRAGVLFDILKVMQQRRVNVQSTLVYPDREAATHKVIVLRVRTMNPVGIVDDLKKAGHHVLWPNMPGART